MGAGYGNSHIAVRQANGVRIIIQTVIGQKRQHIQVVLEILDLDRDDDLVFTLRRAEAVPKSPMPSCRELSGSVGSKMSRNA
jgi:hypothetical protein